MSDEILFTYYEPMLDKEIDVTYDMLSAQGKRDWDSRIFHKNYISSVSYWVEANSEPVIPTVLDSLVMSELAVGEDNK